MRNLRWLSWIGLSFVVLGAFLIAFEGVSVTGGVVSENMPASNLWFVFFTGLTVFCLGFLLIIGAQSHALEDRVGHQDADVHDEAHDASQYNALKKRYSFWQDHGAPPEAKSAWVTGYHAYKRGHKISGYLDPSKPFFMAPDAEHAIEEVEHTHVVDRRDIEVMRVQIAKSVYNDIVSHQKSDIGSVDVIQPKKIKAANSLMHKGLIVFEHSHYTNSNNTKYDKN
jgi:hypothetical protein